MSEQHRMEELREYTLAVLTLVEAQLRPDTVSGQADHDLLHAAYTNEQIGSGAILLANLLVSMESKMLGITPAERIAQIRSMVQRAQLES